MIINSKTRFFCIVSVIVILSLNLCSCSLFKSEPELTVNSGIPVIKNTENDNEINEKLNDYFSEILNSLKNDDNTGFNFGLEYSMYEKSEDKNIKTYVLNNKICCNNKYYCLEDVVIYSDGICKLPSLPSIDALRDGEYINALINLNSCQITADINSYDSFISFSDSLKMNMDAYEYITEQPVEFSDVVNSSSDDEVFKKALALEVISDDNYNYLNDEELYFFTVNLNSQLNKFSEIIYKEKFGKYSQGVNSEEFCSILKEALYNFDVSASTSQVNTINAGWKSLCDTLNFDIINTNSPLTRSDIATIFVDIYRQMFGECKSDYQMELSDIVGETYDNLTQYERENIQNAAALDLLPPMFATDFEPFYTPGFSETINYIYAYVNVLRNYFIETVNDDLYDDEFYNITRCRYDNAVKKTSDFINKFKNMEPVDITVKTVNNSRDYNWYFTQNDGTEYSHVNCMPSITCMAIKWSDQNTTVTPDQLRRLYPDVTEGWYLYMVDECLTKYNVNHKVIEYHEDTIINELDKGNILLVQISQNMRSLSGHCMVIYGYEKIGNSVIYNIHDPDVKEGKNQFDKYFGEDIKLGANYTDFIIRRMSTQVITVSKK